MKIYNSKMTIALPPGKLETKNQIDTALIKIENKLKNCNYEFYYKMLLRKIKVIYCKEYFTNQFKCMIASKKIKGTQNIFFQEEIPSTGQNINQISEKKYFHSVSSNAKKFKLRRKSSKYLFTPYKYFHIIYTGMTS